MVWFGLVWSIHRQTNKLNIYFISINLICEFVRGFCGQEKKEIISLTNNQIE